MSLADSQNYAVLNTVILSKYKINAESYRIKLSNTSRKADETVAEWINNLTYLWSVGQNFLKLNRAVFKL